MFLLREASVVKNKGAPTKKTRCPITPVIPRKRGDFMRVPNPLSLTHAHLPGSTMSAMIPGWRNAPWHIQRENSFDRRETIVAVCRISGVDFIRLLVPSMVCFSSYGNYFLECSAWHSSDHRCAGSLSRVCSPVLAFLCVVFSLFMRPHCFLCSPTQTPSGAGLNYRGSGC